jgi:hypothetical protein
VRSYTFRSTLVWSAGDPATSTTVRPMSNAGSVVVLTGTGPATVSGAASLSTRRCGLVPYRVTVSDDEPTNVLSSSQWSVSLTKRRSVSG